MTDSLQLGDLQFAVLRVLWARGESTALEVHATLQAERALAPTTVATTLTKMEKKGLLEHRVEGRRFIYRAVAPETEIRRSMVGELLQRVFHGDAQELVSHLLREGELGDVDLTRLQKRINEHQEKSDD